MLLFIYYNGDVMQIKISEIENKSNIIDIRTSTEFNEFNIGGRNITRMNLLKNPEYYLDKNNNLNLRSLFNNTKPKTIYRVEIKDEYDK